MEVKQKHIDLILKKIYDGLECYFNGEHRRSWDVLPMDFKGLSAVARRAQEFDGRAISRDDDLLDAVRRMDAFFACPAFQECPRARCEGIVYCPDYNLGQSHGVYVTNLSRKDHRELILSRFSGRDEGNVD